MGTYPNLNRAGQGDPTLKQKKNTDNKNWVTLSCSIGVDCHVIATFKFSVENLSLSKVKPNRTGRSDSLKVRTAEATATERTKQRTTESSPVGRSKKRSPSSTYMTTRSERLECSCSSSRSRRKRRDLDCRAASSVSLTCCPERKKERKKERRRRMRFLWQKKQCVVYLLDRSCG